MTTVRRLADLWRDGSPDEQSFAHWLVTSELGVPPELATRPEWGGAWRAAQRRWQRTNRGLSDEGCPPLEAEHRAIRALTRGAIQRLYVLGYEPAVILVDGPN